MWRYSMGKLHGQLPNLERLNFYSFPNAQSHSTHFKGCCSSLTSYQVFRAVGGQNNKVNTSTSVKCTLMLEESNSPSLTADLQGMGRSCNPHEYAFRKDENLQKKTTPKRRLSSPQNGKARSMCISRSFYATTVIEEEHQARKTTSGGAGGSAQVGAIRSGRGDQSSLE